MVRNRIVGVGSPHGDDQVGWRVVELLAEEHFPDAEVIAIRSASQLVDCFSECQRAIVVDACQTGSVPGTITRLEWPDARMARPRGPSTHGLGVVGAIELADRLGRLPPEVILYGVEMGACRPATPLSPAVESVLPELARRVGHEMRRAASEGHGPVGDGIPIQGLLETRRVVERGMP